MGDSVKIDEEGRIVIPAEIRKVVGKRSLHVEMADKDTIILRASTDPSELVEKIRGMRLDGDEARSSVDFSEVKDLYGGKRVEITPIPAETRRKLSTWKPEQP